MKKKILLLSLKLISSFIPPSLVFLRPSAVCWKHLKSNKKFLKAHLKQFIYEKSFSELQKCAFISFARALVNWLSADAQNIFSKNMENVKSLIRNATRCLSSAFLPSPIFNWNLKNWNSVNLHIKLPENCVSVVRQWWMIRSTLKCQLESTLWTSEFPVLRAFSFSTSETKEEKSFNLKVFPISAEFPVRMKSNLKSGPWKMIFWFSDVFSEEV